MFHQIFPDGPEPSSPQAHSSAKPGNPRDAVTRRNADDASRSLAHSMDAQRLEPPEAPGRDGIPALHIALSTGNADAVRAFGEQLHAVPGEQRARLLAARGPDGVPGLQRALQRGHADAIRAFAALLVHLPAEQRTDILAGGNQDRGAVGLRLALRNLHADAIREFDTLLKCYCVPMQRCAGQIMDAANDLHFVLHRIGQDGDSAALAAAEAYFALAARAAPALHPAQRENLLKCFQACHATGHPECASWFSPIAAALRA